MKKIIVKLNGGLGNQMFQYAFAKSMALKYSLDVVFDFSFFDEVKNGAAVATRFYELSYFNLICHPVVENDFKMVKKPDFESKLKNILAKKFPALFGVNYVREKKNYIFDRNLMKPCYLFYDGYFQNEKYFKSIRDKLLADFSLKEPLNEQNKACLDKIKNSNSISLHIRRGDYVTISEANEVHGICSLDYYKKAVDFVTQKVQSPHLFIFSDEPDWVLANFQLECPYTVVDINKGKGWLDMELMKNCKHNIIANSSFSWWGAWLNQNTEKIVIAPKNWLAVKQRCDIVPANWIKL